MRGTGQNGDAGDRGDWCTREGQGRLVYTGGTKQTPRLPGGDAGTGTADITIPRRHRADTLVTRRDKTQKKQQTPVTRRDMVETAYAMVGRRDNNNKQSLRQPDTPEIESTRRANRDSMRHQDNQETHCRTAHTAVNIGE